MSKLKNVWQVLSGLLLLVVAFLIACTDWGTSLVVIIVSFSILIYAIKQLALYFTTARYMVGGKSILFKGYIALDFAVFFLTLQDIKTQYIMIYLIIMYLASGAIDLFRALEIKKLHNKSWKSKAFAGGINIILGILCLIFIKSYNLMCFIYGIGLALSAIRRIREAFTKTAMVYIQ